MSNYINWAEQTINPDDTEAVASAYDNGFVFVRTANGAMQQTRSLRIDLSGFELTSENRRILRKTEGLDNAKVVLPIQHKDYDWQIHKLGKDFYSKKFGDKTFSAAKIRHLLTSVESNFNLLLDYKFNEEQAGYAICYEGSTILHYAYPFYYFEKYPLNLGMAMMINAALYAKESGKNYCYLGSVRSVRDLYKLQFSGLSYYTGSEWSTDLTSLKEQLRGV